MRIAVVAALVLAIAGCADSALTGAEYRDLVAERAAAYADEAEEVRSIHLFELDRAIDDLVKEKEGADLEAAAIDEAGRSSASLFARIADAVDRYASDLSAVRPPQDLAGAHLEYVEALRLSITGIGATVEALAAATSFDAIDEAIGGSTFNDTQFRVDAACRRLEAAMGEQGLTANLHCRQG